MDFFAAQEQARKRTKTMVLLFCLAVLCIALALYGVFIGVLESGVLGSDQSRGVRPIVFWRPELFFGTLLGIFALVTSCSFFKIAQLRAGGGVVARSVGGRLLDRATVDADERRLLNVVEEISIASGVAMPDVYILSEQGINAFAAGFKPADAVIGVTKGCIQSLSRDELQGVVAHEFSHILNGDMRLNIRLMGVVFGILAIAVIGRMAFRFAAEAGFWGSTSRRRRDDKEGGGGIIFLVIAVGLAVMAIGYIGVFFGRLIQSAISRQREFLADAAAVQFTRNPEGISGALKKIGGSTFGGMIQSAHTQETAHFFFANALKLNGGGFYATHPPLPKRIRAIEPNWDGEFTHVEKKVESPPMPVKKPERSFSNASDFMAAVGQISVAAVMDARQIRSELESDLAKINTSIETSRGLLFALLIAASSEGDDLEQLALLEGNVASSVLSEAKQWLTRLRALNLNQRFALFDSALPKAVGSDVELLEGMLPLFNEMAHSDGQIDLEELAFIRSVRGYIRDRKTPSKGPKNVPPSEMEMPVCVLLSVVVYSCGVEFSDAQRAEAFKSGARKCGRFLLREAILLPTDAISFDALEIALDLFQELPPSSKKALFEGTLAVVLADGHVAEEELSLIRVIAVSLGLPMPPLSVS